MGKILVEVGKPGTKGLSDKTIEVKIGQELIKVAIFHCNKFA